MTIIAQNKGKSLLLRQANISAIGKGQTIMAYILLILGFALLIKGADFFVEGASHIARALHVSPLLIGLTIVALGTSSPEATVSIVAALQESSGVSVGNVIGSNIFNITLVVGLTAYLNPLKVKSETVKKQIPFTLLASTALLIVISDKSLEHLSENLITRSDGFILLLFRHLLYYYLKSQKIAGKKVKQEVRRQNLSRGVKI